MITILAGGMLLMCLFSSLVILLFSGLGLLLSVLIAAVVTPTDPVVASSIVSGDVAKKYLPAKVRHFISAESSANDGLAFCIVFLPLLFLTESSSHPWQEWLLKVLLWQNAVSVFVGFAVGYAAGALVSQSLRKELTDTESFLAFTISLGFMVLGLMEVIHCNGVIAVFAAGVGLAHKTKGSSDKLEAERCRK